MNICRYLAVALAAISLSAVMSNAQAQNGARIPGSILGVHVGATRAQVQQALEAHGTVAGRETRDGGRKDAWTLRDTDFSALAVRTNKRGEVVWVNAFVRPERELPFSAIGDLSAALQKMDTKVVWQSDPQASGGGKKYQLIASGKNGHAQTLLLIAVEPASPQ